VSLLEVVSGLGAAGIRYIICGGVAGAASPTISTSCTTPRPATRPRWRRCWPGGTPIPAKSGRDSRSSWTSALSRRARPSIWMEGPGAPGRAGGVAGAPPRVPL